MKVFLALKISKYKECKSKKNLVMQTNRLKTPNNIFIFTQAVLKNFLNTLLFLILQLFNDKKIKTKNFQLSMNSIIYELIVIAIEKNPESYNFSHALGVRNDYLS